MSKKRFMPSMFIGTTAGVPSPVFFNLHSSIRSSSSGGGAPVTVITGGPGSGKTYCGLNLTTQAAIAGYTVFVIDYKGDFAALKSIESFIGRNVDIWEIRDPKFYGALDPFKMTTNVDERVALIMSLINIFVGGMTNEEESAIGSTVRDCAKRKNGVLEDVGKALQGLSVGSELEKSLSRGVGARFINVLRVEEAKICSAAKKRGGAIQESKSMKVKPGSITVATLLGLSLPKNSNQQEDKGDYSMRAASGILYLITTYIKDLLISMDGPPKVLVIDEAWAILSTKYGTDTVKSTAALGRSRELATLLITQNPSHYAHLDIENTIGTRFCFRASDKEAESIIKDVSLPEDEGWDTILTNLGNGECLFSNGKQKYSLVRIDVFDSEWRYAFETDPSVVRNRNRKIKENRMMKATD